MSADPRQLNLLLMPGPVRDIADEPDTATVDKAAPDDIGVDQPAKEAPSEKPSGEAGEAGLGWSREFRERREGITKQKEALRSGLESAFGRQIQLVLTQNRSRIASVKETKTGFELRLHRSFLIAPPPTLDAVATYFSTPPGPKRRQALALLREHFQRHAPQTSKKPTRRVRGRFHDLEALRDRINQDYFDGAIDVLITWGQNAAGRKRRRGAGFSIRLGSYDEATRLVRIHPVLDRKEVPRYVVAAVVHHEMLHAAVPPEPIATPGGGRRRRVHSPEFRRRERGFADHDRAEAWLARHAEKLARWRGR